MDKYLSKDGYGLKYEINVINTYDSKNSIVSNPDAYTTNYEIRLVYRPDIDPSYISPFTGDQVNYNGEVYQGLKPYTYLDVADTDANREILLLSDMNIGFEGNNFSPDKVITRGELNDLLEKVGYGYAAEETVNKDQPITREEVAQSFISKLGLAKVAAISGIYQTGFADDYNISKDYYGAVALAKGLGLMQADSSNNFNPKSNVTRAEAVHLILSFIGVQQNGILW
jgi:hypothetical protein